MYRSCFRPEHVGVLYLIIPAPDALTIAVRNEYSKVAAALFIVGESTVKSGHTIKKWSNFAMAKPISKVVKCGQKSGVQTLDRKPYSY